MDNSVIITICITALIAWAIWLIYNYKVFKNTMVIESNNNKYKARCNRLIACIEDLIGDINKKFPNSTLKYTYTENTDAIEGEIKVDDSIEL